MMCEVACSSVLTTGLKHRQTNTDTLMGMVSSQFHLVLLLTFILYVVSFRLSLPKTSRCRSELQLNSHDVNALLQNNDLLQKCKKTTITGLVSLGLLFNTGVSRAVFADDPAGSGILSEVWGLVNENYVDPSYNNNDWNKVKDDYFDRVKRGADERELTKKMMSLLGDKYSRFLDKKVFEGLWKYDAIGVGLLFQSDNDKRMFVAAPPIGGSSADKAGTESSLFKSLQVVPTNVLVLTFLHPYILTNTSSLTNITARFKER